jgi:hypothetical protein
MMGAVWPHHDLLRHLFGLSLPWLERWGPEHGLRQALATTRDEGSLHFNRFFHSIKACRLAFSPQLEPNVFGYLG